MFGANGFARTRPALVIPDIRPLSWAPLVVVTRRAGEQINFALPILGQRNDTDLRAEDLLRVVKACRWHGASSPFDSNLARHSRRLPAPVGDFVPAREELIEARPETPDIPKRALVQIALSGRLPDFVDRG
jgi:hypothetical protein